MASKRDVTVKSLSSNLLQMKFMKKSVISAQERDDKDLYDTDGEHWVINADLCKKYRDRVEISPNFEQCEQLMYGRMSFKGFNPRIEKVMRVMNGEEEEGEATAETEEDKKFVEEYTNVTGIAKKFDKNNKRFRYEMKNQSQSGNNRPVIKGRVNKQKHRKSKP